MKTTLLFLSILFYTSPLFAQYVPFPEGDTRWSMSQIPYQDPEDWQTQGHSWEYGYYHELKGDTTIDNQIYQKVYERRTWWKHSYSYETSTEYINYTEADNEDIPAILIGAIRQDLAARMIYYRTLKQSNHIISNGFQDLPLEEDIVLFDFSVDQIGDTMIHYNRTFVVNNIDSIQLNDGTYRKRYQTYWMYPEENGFLEGIGGQTTGLFGGIWDTYVEGDFISLNCFTQEEERLLGNSMISCDTVDKVVPIQVIDTKTKWMVSPNPFTNAIQVDLQTTKSENYQLRLFNSLGQLLSKEAILPQQSLQMETAQLPVGIYFLSIYQNDQWLDTQKITKTN